MSIEELSASAAPIQPLAESAPPPPPPPVIPPELLAIQPPLRDTADIESDTAHDRRIFYLGSSIVFVVLIIVVLLFFVTIPATNKDVLNTVIGLVVGTGFGSVVGFYFGSSSASKTKDDTITNLTAKVQQ